MIGKVIGAFVGDKIARKATGGVNGATGAALGVLATSVLRRMSLPAMLVVAAGGYAAKKLMDKDKANGSGATGSGSTGPYKTAEPARPKVKSSAT